MKKGECIVIFTITINSPETHDINLLTRNVVGDWSSQHGSITFIPELRPMFLAHLISLSDVLLVSKVREIGNFH